MAKRVVILGAGYSGVRCALTLQQEGKPNETEILLINKNNYHKFAAQSSRSAVGTGDEGEVRLPLGEIFDTSKVKIIVDEVNTIVPQNNTVILKGGTLEYDNLVVALGSEAENFDIPGLEQYSLSLRSLNSLKVVKAHIEKNLLRFKEQPVKRELLTIVIGGAGFTGAEITSAIAGWMPGMAEKYQIPETLINVVTIEATTAILAGFDRQLIENTYRVLQEKGVRVITNVSIETVTQNEVRLTSGEAIRNGTFIWAGGIRANRVTAQAGFATVVRGRAKVNRHLQAVDYPNVYVIGDNAFIINPDTGEVMAPTPWAAIQSGYVAARNILNDVRGENPEVLHPGEVGAIIMSGKYPDIRKLKARTAWRGSVVRTFRDRISWKYLYSLGGVKLVAKKFLK